MTIKNARCYLVSAMLCLLLVPTAVEAQTQAELDNHVDNIRELFQQMRSKQPTYAFFADNYELLRQMQEETNAAEELFVNLPAGNLRTTTSLNSIVRIHVILAIGGAMLGDEAFYLSHWQIATSRLNSYFGGGDTLALLQGSVEGFEVGAGLSLWDIFRQDLPRYEAQWTGGTRLRLSFRGRAVGGLPEGTAAAAGQLAKYSVALADPEDASPRAHLFAAWLEYRLSDPLMPYWFLDLEPFRARARDAGFAIEPRDHFMKDPTDLAKSAWMDQIEAEWIDVREVTLSLSVPNGEFEFLARENPGSRSEAITVGPEAVGPGSEIVVSMQPSGVSVEVGLSAPTGMGSQSLSQWLVPTWKLADLNVGINERTRKMEGSIAGRSFHRLAAGLAFQGQAELAFRSHAAVSALPVVPSVVEQVSDFYGTDFQFDLGPVVRTGSFQFAAMSSLRYVTREDFDEGALLTQSLFNFDYVSPRIGQVGAFLTLGHGSAPVVKTTEIEPTLIAETYLKVMNQAGMAFRLNLPLRSSLEGTLAYLNSEMERNRPGGVLRHIVPVGRSVSLAYEVGLNESFVAADDSWRFAFGLRIGDWGPRRSGRSAGMGPDAGPVPVVVPRVRYERLTRNISVLVEEEPEPILREFRVDPPEIEEDETARLRWDVEGVPSVRIEYVHFESGQEGEFDNLLAADDREIMPSVGITRYSLYAIDDSGAVVGTEALAQVEVRVNPRRQTQITSFEAAPTLVAAGETTTLTWTVEGVAGSCRFGPETGGSLQEVGCNQSQTVVVTTPGQTTFVLRVHDENGDIVDEAKVRVAATFF